MNETRSSAHAAVLLLLVSGGVVVACGSSSRDDLFDRDVGSGGRSGNAGTGAGQAGVFGTGGAGGAAGVGAGGAAGAGGSGRGGSGGSGGSGGLSGSGTGGRGGAGAGGNAGGSGATGGVGGSSGIGGSGGRGANGGSQGVSGVGGTQGVGGADAGSTGGTGGSGGTSGSGGTQGIGGSGAGGTSGGNGTGGSGGTPEPPPCVTKASQTVLIGDSYVNWITHSFRSDLARITGESWRLYAAGGSAMASGGIGTMIPQQFENALRADPDIRVVVMDGGGNDILLPASSWSGGSECNDRMDAPNIPVCRQIVQASLDRELVLMDRMADVGVRDVVFFFYPIVPNGTTLGGRYPNAISGWARPQVKEQCDGTYQRTGGRLRCHFVDLVPVFQGHAEYFATGDIHPNTSGSAAMARAVWETMRSACLAQSASSGCCKP